jgi:hypothetical protein
MRDSEKDLIPFVNSDELKSKFEPIVNRVVELSARPAVAKARKVINDVSNASELWTSSLPQVAAEEKDKLQGLLVKASEWIDTMETAQAKVCRIPIHPLVSLK